MVSSKKEKTLTKAEYAADLAKRKAAGIKAWEKAIAASAAKRSKVKK